MAGELGQPDRKAQQQYSLIASDDVAHAVDCLTSRIANLGRLQP
jgi:hypothetical protein